MDSLITAAGRALAAGDPLGALSRVALREDPPALALRGIAMAQLGDFPRARALLRRAARGFAPREAISRARCVVAEAEVALAARDLGFPAARLEEAAATLAAAGDHANAAHARTISIRRLLLAGRLAKAEAGLAALDPAPLPAALRAAHALALAGIAIRRLQAGAAREALGQARGAARQAGIPALAAEVEAAAALLQRPAARLLRRGTETPLTLDAVEALLASDRLILDACRHGMRDGAVLVPLARRPVLFALARALAEAWPGDVPRDVLIARAFHGREADDSHRARLRVEAGRLRALLRPVAVLRATRRGYALQPRRAVELVVLAPPAEERHAAVLALLGDGEAWSSSALAEALGAGQRSVQRALDALAAAGKAQGIGQGRARRWILAPGFTTPLLLPHALPGG